MARHEKTKFQIYLEYIPFYFVLYPLLRHLPLRAAYRLNKVCFWILSHGYFSLRRRTSEHLLHAGIALDAKDASRRTQRVFEEFSKLVVEIVKFDQCFDRQKIRWSGDPDGIRLMQTQNIILASAHYGNWELAGPAIAECSGRPMLSIMRGFSNPLIGEVILRNRRGKMHRLIDKNAPVALRSMLRAMGENQHIAVLIDQHATRNEGVETVFFGHPCRTHRTPALLHLRTGIPIIPEVTWRAPGEDFVFELRCGKPVFHTPTGDKEKDIQTICQRCTSELESLIRQDPDQWLWCHRRWLDLNRYGYTPETSHLYPNKPVKK